jgi:hypothetical protein
VIQFCGLPPQSRQSARLSFQSSKFPPPHPQASDALPPLVPGWGQYSLAGEGGEPIRTKRQTLVYYPSTVPSKKRKARGGQKSDNNLRLFPFCRKNICCQEVEESTLYYWTILWLEDFLIEHVFIIQVCSCKFHLNTSLLTQRKISINVKPSAILPYTCL